MASLINEFSVKKTISSKGIVRVDQKLEAITIQVSDVDRAKEFYG